MVMPLAFGRRTKQWFNGDTRMNTNSPVDQLRRALDDGEVIIFVGAGVSLATSNGARTASWIGLIEHGIDWCRTHAGRDADWETWMRAGLRGDLTQLLGVAEALTKALDAPHGDYAAWLRASLSDVPVITPQTIEALAALDAPLVTTNYDTLLAQVSGLQCITWKDVSTAHSVVRGEDRQHILHLHGVWSRADTVILGVRDYAMIMEHDPSQALLRALQSLRSVLFVGFGSGLSDPNFSALRSWAREVLRDVPRRHFRLVKTADLNEAREIHAQDRIMLIPFDEHGTDLTAFLQALRPKSSGHKLRRAISRPGTLAFWQRYALDGITLVVPPREEDEILRGQHGFAYLGLVLFLQRVAAIIPVSAVVSTEVVKDYSAERTRNLLSFTGPIPNEFSALVLQDPRLFYGFNDHDILNRDGPSLHFAAEFKGGDWPTVDYGLVTCMRSPWAPSKFVLVAAGCFAWGTQAAMRILADDDALTWIYERASGEPFQVICRAEVDAQQNIMNFHLLDCHPNPTLRCDTFRILEQPQGGH